jgi:hypothetical protein
MKIKLITKEPGQRHAVPAVAAIYCCCCYFCTSTCSIGGTISAQTVAE